MRRLIVVLAALTVSAVVLVPSSQAGHSFGGHWNLGLNPLIHFIDSTTSSWDGVVAAAGAEWSQSDALDVVIDPGDDSKKTRRRCSPADGAVRVCNFKYGNTGWVGLTVAVIKGKHFVRVAVKFNETYLGKKNRKVACHEMGHGLGLAHRSTPRSCMKQGAAKKHPDGHDYKMLRKIYDHAHAKGTAADDGAERTVRIEYSAADYFAGR
jgi:hypothetical protein